MTASCKGPIATDIYPESIYFINKLLDNLHNHMLCNLVVKSNPNDGNESAGDAPIWF